MLAPHSPTYPVAPMSTARLFGQRGADPSPLPLRVATAGKKHLNEESTPLLLTGIGQRCSQTISNLGHEALLR